MYSAMNCLQTCNFIYQCHSIPKHFITFDKFYRNLLAVFMLKCRVSERERERERVCVRARARVCAYARVCVRARARARVCVVCMWRCDTVNNM